MWLVVVQTVLTCGQVSKPGDYVVMEALIDCYMVFSTCPQDILGCNADNIVKEAEFQLLDQ